MSISTHVLDTARGRPAADVPVTLSHRGSDGAWSVLGRAVTDTDGRIKELSQGDLAAGVYRLDFDTAHYFVQLGISGLYPEVSVVFILQNPGEHFHVPLLLSPFGYTTYRGT
jgi:5-hydroxyisourate hydrolase